MMIKIYFLTYLTNHKENACKNDKNNIKQHHF